MGGFQLGFCSNDKTQVDNDLSPIAQIAIGYHTGFTGLRLECTADSGLATPLITGDFEIFVR